MRTFLKHKIKTHLAACALAGMAFSGSALGAIVCGASPISIPQNIDGAYINLVTGATGTAGTGVAGWDVNMYLTGAALYFYWPTAPVNSAGGAATGTVYDSLSAGATIGPSQTYSVASGGGGAANFVNWQVASTGKFLGVRFYNEATSAINYAWVQLDTGASGGFPATINQYCYDNTGVAIVAGNTGAPVGSPSFGFTTATLAFGNVTVGTGSAAQTVTLSNTGTASGTAPTLSSSNAVFARTGGTCSAAPITLAAGASCTVAVTFSPVATGAVTGTLSFGTVPNNTPSGFASVALSGTGTAVPGPGGGEPVVTTVPVNSTWALAALLGLFGLIAGVMLRRR